MHFVTSVSDLSFRIRRLHVPHPHSFEMSINKSRCQILDVTRIHFGEQYFSNGQSFIACSNIGTPANFVFYVFAEKSCEKYRMQGGIAVSINPSGQWLKSSINVTTPICPVLKMWLQYHLHTLPPFQIIKLSLSLPLYNTNMRLASVCNQRFTKFPCLNYVFLSFCVYSVCMYCYSLVWRVC